jgi:Mn-dependent DtxR family transcriptional regulator
MYLEVTSPSSVSAAEIYRDLPSPRQTVVLTRIATIGAGGRVRSGDLLPSLGDYPAVATTLGELRRRGWVIGGGRDGVELTVKGKRVLHKARDMAGRLVVEFNAAVEALEGAA